MAFSFTVDVFIALALECLPCELVPSAAMGCWHLWVLQEGQWVGDTWTRGVRAPWEMWLEMAVGRRSHTRVCSLGPIGRLAGVGEAWPTWKIPFCHRVI